VQVSSSVVAMESIGHFGQIPWNLTACL
jgi:hypothetical protein